MGDNKLLQFLNGSEVVADGKLQTLLHMLYQQISGQQKMVFSPQMVADEVRNLVAQMNDTERAQYLVQSLIVNFTFFDREMIREGYEKKTKKGSNGSSDSSPA